MVLKKGLDIGVGTGTVYSFRTRLTVDTEPHFVDLNKPVPKLKRLGAWVTADSLNLPFRKEVFDTVILSHVIEHVRDWRGAIEEAYRVLKRGGELHVYVPGRYSRNVGLDPCHIYVPSSFELHRFLKKLSMRVRYGVAIGSRIPKLVRRLATHVINYFLEEVHVIGVKV